jgi:hypothetical protein
LLEILGHKFAARISAGLEYVTALVRIILCIGFDLFRGI